MSWLILIIIGLVAGSVGTLVGAGGGFLIIPLLLFLFPELTPQQVIGTSLAVVFLNGLSGTVAYARQKKIFYDAAIKFTIATIPGAIIGSYASAWFSARTYHLVFGALLAVIAVSLMIRGPKKQGSSNGQQFPHHYKQGLGIFISFIIGFISSIIGIGGGIVHVPAMVMLLEFPPHVATATSHFVLACSSFVGSISHAWLQHIDYLKALIIGCGIIPGAQIGAAMSKKVQGRAILITLSVILLSVGIRLIVTS